MKRIPPAIAASPPHRINSEDDIECFLRLTRSLVVTILALERIMALI
jgi:hypothetical protein